MKILADFGSYYVVSTSSKMHNTLLDIEDYHRLRELGNITLSCIFRHCSSVRASGLRFVLNKKTHVVGRFILGCSDPDMVVDHINQNPLDNRKENLRVVTQRENSLNGPTNIALPGVTYVKRRDKYQAQIMFNRRRIYLGYYRTAEAAHKAYNAFKFANNIQ